MSAYQHGGDIAAFAKQCGCSPSEVIDLSSNINFVKPCVNVDFNTLDISPYPDYDRLYDAVASHYGVGAEAIELFNGGSAAIFSFFRHIKDGHRGLPLRCTIYTPAYLEYQKAAEVFGYALEAVNRFETLDAHIAPHSLVIFVNPATPDGKYYDIKALLAYWHAQNCTVLIDESFLEFTPYDSATALLAHYPNLYILKSMTKFWGAAGIRIGTLLSQRHNIKALKRTEPLWKLSAFDCAYIQSALKDRGLKARSDDAHAKSRTYLLALLSYSSYVAQIYPGEANFVLVRLQHIDAHTLQEKLTPYRVMIRNCENFEGLDSTHIRIAIKSIEELSVLKEVLHA